MSASRCPEGRFDRGQEQGMLRARGGITGRSYSRACGATARTFRAIIMACGSSPVVVPGSRHIDPCGLWHQPPAKFSLRRELVQPTIDDDDVDALTRQACLLEASASIWLQCVDLGPERVLVGTERTPVVGQAYSGLGPMLIPFACSDLPDHFAELIQQLCGLESERCNRAWFCATASGAGHARHAQTSRSWSDIPLWDNRPRRIPCEGDHSRSPRQGTKFFVRPVLRQPIGKVTIDGISGVGIAITPPAIGQPADARLRRCHCAAPSRRYLTSDHETCFNGKIGIRCGIPSRGWDDVARRVVGSDDG